MMQHRSEQGASASRGTCEEHRLLRSFHYVQAFAPRDKVADGHLGDLLRLLKKWNEAEWVVDNVVMGGFLGEVNEVGVDFVEGVQHPVIVVQGVEGLEGFVGG